MKKNELSKKDIMKLLKTISCRLKQKKMQGEIVLFGGSVMTVVFDARKSTKDIDAIFQPPKIIREIAIEIGRENSLPDNWLNDSVKAFVSEKGKHSLYYEDANLKIFAAVPEYILAMKCMSMRLSESKDEEDIVFLIKKLKLNKKENVFNIVEKYYPRKQIPPKTQYAIEEFFERLSLN